MSEGVSENPYMPILVGLGDGLLFPPIIIWVVVSNIFVVFTTIWGDDLI